MISTSQTLAEQMTSGRMPIGEVLRTGMQLADQLRQLHEQGIVHGTLSPWTVATDGQAVEICAPPDGGNSDSPYTAPEVAAGKPADARSDIYSFGAIFYEMFTGRPAFDGSSQAPPPSGDTGVDRLVNGCLASAPEARFQRVQKLMLELKLLSSAARRGGVAPASVAPPVYAAPPAYVPPPAPAPVAAPACVPPPTPPPAPVPQMSDFERRITARLEEQERSVAAVAQVANELLKAFRQQQQPPAPAPPPAYAPAPSLAYAPAPRTHTRSFTFDAVDGHSGGRTEQTLDALADRIARLDLVVSSAVERLQKLEENLDAFDTDAAALRDSVTRDIRNFERALKAQSTAIDSARTAMGQTDDLVERVVEALDSLQSMFVTSDERSLAS